MATAEVDRKFFHESWYRIAAERLSLRASVRVRRQLFRGRRWYVLHEPFSNQFFRLGPAAYEFVARLDANRTVDEVWHETIEREPEDAPGQEEVIQLLSQLYHANLLHYDLPADSEKLFERYKERKQTIRRATLQSIMFFRIPLFDPSAFLQTVRPFIRFVVSPLGAIVWVAAVAGAISLVIGRFAELRVQTQGILSLSNIPLLYLSIILIKTIHEFGHAGAVARFGGTVHTMGVMFLIFNPLPYTDSTAAWAFRSKWQRVLVGAAGILTELFVASLAVFTWANTGPGTLHALAYNMMIVASVSTLVFNVNPLMRFDGYYILSDLLDIPNLHGRSSRQLRHIVERYAFGFKKSEPPTPSRSEAAWLTIFGILSGMYRIVVFATILLVIADRFLLLGIIMAAICAVAWVVTPLLKLVHYLAASPRLERTRLRAAVACLAAAGGLIGVLAIIPFPASFRAPGVIRAVTSQIVVNEVAGYLTDLTAEPNTRVQRGDILLRLANRTLDYQVQEVEHHLEQIRFLHEKALVGSPADLRAIESTLESIEKQLVRLHKQQADLVVKAENGGIWVAPQAKELGGAWIPRGTRVGEVIDDGSFYFASVISEENVSEVFAGGILDSGVRLANGPECTLSVTGMTQIPIGRTELPSAALGLQGGGSVATSGQGTAAPVASQPFHELRLTIVGCPQQALYQGLTGEVHFQLRPQPLLVQAYLKLRQLVQQRYQM